MPRNLEYYPTPNCWWIHKSLASKLNNSSSANPVSNLSMLSVLVGIEEESKNNGLLLVGKKQD
jgi:hypothetical protein